MKERFKMSFYDQIRRLFFNAHTLGFGPADSKRESCMSFPHN